MRSMQKILPLHLAQNHHPISQVRVCHALSWLHDSTYYDSMIAKAKSMERIVSMPLIYELKLTNDQQ